mgnify:FL=1|jgi:hypothetical protein|tara:strand:+ start:1246 stop:1359 length:114 start_codon:yes stop_codon:yes gene_type:complete
MGGALELKLITPKFFWNDLEKIKPTVNIVIINEYKIE